MATLAHILIVEDEEDIASLVQTSLREHGYRVSAATTSEQAIVFLKSDPSCDVILLDYFLPGRDGSAVLEALQEDARFQNIKVILTSSVLFDDERWLKELAPVSWKPITKALLKKPYQISELLATIKEVLKQSN